MRKKTIGCILAAIAQGAALPAAPAQTGPAEVFRVCPRGGPNSRDVVLTIEGRNFTAQTQVALRDVQGLSTPLSVVVVHSGLVRAVVPAGTQQGLYSIEVTNGVRPSDILDSSYTVSGGTAFMDAVPIPGPGSGYALRSIPQYCTVADLLTALENALGPYNPVLYRVLVWRGGRYRDLVDLPRDCDLSGQSFWILGKAAGTANVGAPDCFAATGTPGSAILVLPLEPGWNQISLPFYSRSAGSEWLSWSDVFVDTDSALSNRVSTGTATALIGSPYAWDGRAYVQATNLVVGEGYFVYNRTPGLLYVIFDALYLQGWTKGIVSSGAETPPPPPGAPAGEDGGEGSSCGLLGWDAVALLALVRLRVRRRGAAGA